MEYSIRALITSKQMTQLNISQNAMVRQSQKIQQKSGVSYRRTHKIAIYLKFGAKFRERMTGDSEKTKPG